MPGRVGRTHRPPHRLLYLTHDPAGEVDGGRLAVTLHPPHLPRHTHSSPQISPSGLSTSRQIPALRPLAGSPAGLPVSCQVTWSVRSSHIQCVHVGVSSCFFPSLTFSLLLPWKKPCQWESLLVTLVLSARGTLSPPRELQGLSESRPAPSVEPRSLWMGRDDAQAGCV